MERGVAEFRIRGVKTSIPFLVQMVTNEVFLKGEATTRLIDTTPDLVELPRRRDRLPPANLPGGDPRQRK